MKTLSRTQQLTRRNLMDALLGILSHKPLERIGIREITDAAGYNRSTFYLYFTDIYDLADAVKRERLTELSEAVRKVREEMPKAPLGDLFGSIVYVVTPHLETIDLCSRLPGFMDAFRQVIAPLFSGVTGVREEDSRFGYLLSLATTIMLHNIRYLSEHPDDLSLPEMMGLIQQVILPGVESLIKESASA